MKGSQIREALSMCHAILDYDMEVTDIDTVSNDKVEQVIISFKHKDGSEDKYYHNIDKN